MPPRISCVPSRRHAGAEGPRPPVLAAAVLGFLLASCGGGEGSSLADGSDAAGPDPSSESAGVGDARPPALPRASRLAADHARLVRRVEELEASGRHATFLAALEEHHARRASSDTLVFEGWTLGWHELELLLELNAPGEGSPSGAPSALDLERDGHPLPVIRQYSDELRARGITLLLVSIPSRVQVHTPGLPGFPAREGGPLGELGTARFHLALNEAGVEVLDLLPVFEEALGEGSDEDLLFQRYDTHWTPRATALAAAHIAERVQQLEGYEPGSLVEGVDYERVPGLVACKVRKLKPRPPEPERLPGERILALPGGAPVEPRSGGPVLLLGDSFTEQFVDQGAGLAAHLHAALGQPIDQIAILQGAANSTWRTLARRPTGVGEARVVVWVVSLAGFWGRPFKKLPLRF